MENKRNKKFFLSHKKSSALVVSIALHVVFIAVALTFVAVQVYIKPEQTFEAKEVKRPKMKLRKLQVPVKQQKKAQAPKLRKTIVTKKQTNLDIKMPEIVGIKGGTGYGAGGGLGGLGFGFDMDLFGSNSKGTGNEFIGRFYDLKQTSKGERTPIGEAYAKNKNVYNPEASGLCCEVIYRFVKSGFRERELEEYFVAPKQKYATTFYFPKMGAGAAPAAFGVDGQVDPSYWLCIYRGQIAAPETGRYRFWGFGDDVLIVRAKRRVVLDACWPNWIGTLSDWSNNDENNRVFPVNDEDVSTSPVPGLLEGLRKAVDSVTGNGAWIGGADGNLPGKKSMAFRLVAGDWFEMRKGERVDVEILIGEIPGGWFSSQLLIEQKGKDYATAMSDVGERQVFPLFKTTPVAKPLLDKMKLNPKVTTPEGPSFGVLGNAE